MSTPPREPPEWAKERRRLIWKIAALGLLFLGLLAVLLWMKSISG
jgi:hypothetical protein